MNYSDRQGQPPTEKKEKVRAMFNNIAGRYDFLNHFLSLGIDHYWRKRVVRFVKTYRHSEILDVATGTADLAIALSKLKPLHITGIDISPEMLNIGREKVSKKGLGNLISLEVGDSESLPYSDGKFDVVTAAFGVRNFEDLPRGLGEMNRVLRQGGHVVILEFSQVSGLFWKPLFTLYFRFILPIIGKMVSRHDFAYSYLPESVGKFPSGDDFLRVLREAGFANTFQVRLSGGISTIYSGEKNTA